MVDKTPRNAETREAEARPRTWTRPSALPTPPPEEGWKFRWIRTAMMGESDGRNVSMRFREGYEPVAAKDFPDFQVLSDMDTRFPENIEIGGLLLCRIPAEIVEDRSRQMQQVADAQMQSVDNTFLKENDPRMPLLKPERSSRSNFGTG